MAIFKDKDRAKRRADKPLHESGLLSAEESWFYSDELNPAHQLQESYEAYFATVRRLGGTPYSREVFVKKFRARMRRAGFSV